MKDKALTVFWTAVLLLFMAVMCIGIGLGIAQAIFSR